MYWALPNLLCAHSYHICLNCYKPDKKFIRKNGLMQAGSQHSLQVNIAEASCHLYAWQESHENGHKSCELLVLFSSCGILSVGSRTDDRPLPRQTFPEPHKSTMTSFAKYDVSFTQWQLSPSTKPSHIIPQGPHHHQEFFKRSPVGFLLKSTGNRPRSWVQG